MKLYPIEKAYIGASGAMYAVVRTPRGEVSLRVPDRVGRAMAIAIGEPTKMVLSIDAGVAKVQMQTERIWLGDLPADDHETFIYYEWVGEGAAPDICAYCGANNGPQGEGRVGWACGVCGCT